MTRALVLSIAALMAVLAPDSASAWHKRTPAVLQIAPQNAGTTIANPRWAGYRYVFFDSDGDIVGNGSQGRQVFYFDLQERDRTGDLAVHQLTSGAGDFQRASSGIRGKVVAYDGTVGGSGPRQIFVADRVLGQPHALTRGAADSQNANMDDGGRVVVFESSADLLGRGIAGTHIYRADLTLSDPTCPYPCPEFGNVGLTQLTNKPGTSRNASTSKTGKVIVFESDADLTNGGETETQIYKVAFPALTTTALSHGPGAAHNPVLSRTGGDIAFESSADLTGRSTGGTQIYLFRQSVGVVQQITSGPSGHSVRPSIEVNGRALIFISSDDLLGNGSSGTEAFNYDLKTTTLSQITDVAGFTSNPAYSAGVFTTVITDDDLAGTGNTGIGLYLVNLFALGNDVLP
jgi:Tol biopolymer transport system component